MGVEDKMTKSSDSEFFARYADINSKLRHNLENIKQYASKLKEHSDEVRDDALKTSTTFFGGNLISVGDMDRIVETLEFNETKLNEVVDALADVIDKENKAIHENLGKLKINEAEIKSELDTLLISYNETKQRERSTFSSLLGIVMKVAHDIIGIVEEEDDKLVKDFMTHFKGLKHMLDNKGGNDQIFAYFKSLLSFLKTVQSGAKLSMIIDKVNKGDSKILIKHFKKLNHGNTITEKFDGFDVKDKTFDQIDGDDKKDKVAKFMRSTLKDLFTDIKVSAGKDYDFDDLIKVKADINELEKKYMDRLNLLIEHKLQNEKIADNKGHKDFEFKLGSKWISFEKFESGNDFKIKKLLESACDEIKRLIDSKKEKTPYLTFKNHNIDNFVIDSKKPVNDDDEDDSEFSDGEKFKSGDINNFITEAKDSILGTSGIEGIESILDSLFDENGSFTAGAKDSLNDYKIHIIKLLKTIGRNLDKYSETKNNWDGNLIGDLKKGIKSLIKGFSNFSSKSKIEDIISDVKHLLSKL